MQDPLPSAALAASRYETADPATGAELKRNEAVRALHLALARSAGAQEPAGAVLQLRAGQRR